MRDWAYECIDVVFLPIDGDPSKTKCVVYDASFDYEYGEFDDQQASAHYYSTRHGKGRQSIHAFGGAARIKDLRVRELASAWSATGSGHSADTNRE